MLKLPAAADLGKLRPVAAPPLPLKSIPNKVTEIITALLTVAIKSPLGSVTVGFSNKPVAALSVNDLVRFEIFELQVYAPPEVVSSMVSPSEIELKVVSKSAGAPTCTVDAANAFVPITAIRAMNNEIVIRLMIFE
jgi:hypothetical protein